MQEMSWEKLLSGSRAGKAVKLDVGKVGTNRRPPWQADFDRITFSSAFRRMQDKTQVFPLSSSDYVRTRLTHSMEAASVARTLGNWVGYDLKEAEKLPNSIHPLEIGMIVAAATLAHDIGNPPFGHSGEDAIRHWFTTSETVTRINNDGCFSTKEICDFENFEGNAQGFRILVKLQMYKEAGGMRLTDATLGAFCKYPAEVWRGELPPDHPVSGKKFGFFQSEASVFTELANRLGLLPRSGDRNSWSRHALAFLVEAADDICYRIVDFEDAVQQKLIRFEDVKDLLLQVSKLGAVAVHEDDIGKEEEREQINHLRALAIGAAVEQCAKAFIQSANYTRLMSGTLDKSLIELTPCASAFSQIKKLQKQHVYSNERVLRVETAGFRVISGLLEHFFEAECDVSAKGGNATQAHKKLHELLPEQYKTRDGETPYNRLLRVTDYICGMTDRYAVDLYRNIVGISIP